MNSDVRRALNSNAATLVRLDHLVILAMRDAGL